MCCLVLRSNFALLLTIQFALLISSLINIISLLLTTLEFFIFGGSLLGRIQGDREPVSFFVMFTDLRRDLKLFKGEGKSCKVLRSKKYNVIHDIIYVVLSTILVFGDVLEVMGIVIIGIKKS